MWEELNYSLDTVNGLRRLVLRSNYTRTEDGQGLIDNGDYSVYEDLTPFDNMTEEEVDAHFEKAAHWDAEPYLDIHGTYLGMLHVNLANPEVFSWNGTPDALTLAQQAELVEYLTTTDFDPDVDVDFDLDHDGTYVNEDGTTEIHTFSFGGLTGLQPDQSVHFLESYKTNAIRVKLSPVERGYEIFFDDEVVGYLIRGETGKWVLQDGLYKDDALTARIGAKIDELTK